MLYIILIILLLGLLFGPQLWVRHVLRKYNSPQPHIPGSGGELAHHLVERFQLDGVGVEPGDKDGDHYDPVNKKIRLSPEYFTTNSLTAVAIAAHEVGHAIQHHRNEPLLSLRTRLSYLAITAQKLSGGLLVVIPFVMALTRAPSAGLVMLVIGVASMLLGTLVQLVTLPVEIDASFNKALPLLKQGNYIRAEDEKHVTKILRAAAFTYLAGSLSSLLNLWRWVAILKK
jgi:Zn-dependent membrane protease YugP